MSLGLGQAFPEKRRAASPPWTAAPRPPKPAPRRVRVRWTRVLLTVGVTALALAGALAGAWKIGLAGRSPFEGLLPADTPVVLEGEASAVIEALRRAPGSGSRILADFGLTRSLAEGAQRILVARLSGPAPEEARLCRTHLARLVDALEAAWRPDQGYPASLPEARPCPCGGRETFRRDGEDFVLECRGANHEVRYDSRLGFPEEPSAEPVVLVAIEQGRTGARRASLVSRGGGGLRLLCNQPERLDHLLADRGPRLALPGPAGSPLRLAARTRDLRDLFPGLLQGLPEDGRVELWGDPLASRWSVRLAGKGLAASPGEEDSARLLSELPASPVAFAGSPELLRRLGLAPEGVDLAPVREVGVALEGPLTRERAGEEIALALAGRTPAVLAARFGSPARLRPWMQASAWKSVLDGRSRDARLQSSGDAALLHLGPEPGTVETRPSVPEGPAKAGLAGWVTLRESAGQAGLYGFSAGLAPEGCWLEIARQAALPAPARRPEAVPVLQSR